MPDPSPGTVQQALDYLLAEVKKREGARFERCSCDDCRKLREAVEVLDTARTSGTDEPAQIAGADLDRARRDPDKRAFAEAARAYGGRARSDVDADLRALLDLVGWVERRVIDGPCYEDHPLLKAQEARDRIRERLQGTDGPRPEQTERG